MFLYLFTNTLLQFVCKGLSFTLYTKLMLKDFYMNVHQFIRFWTQSYGSGTHLRGWFNIKTDRKVEIQL